MRITRPLLRGATLSAMLVLSAIGAAGAADRCAAPDDTDGIVMPLPHVAGVLKPGATLDVLTIGSATVFSPTESLLPGTVTGQALGIGKSAATTAPIALNETAFPLQMARELREAIPGLTVNVTVKGGRGLTAGDMLDVLRGELAAHKYELVIWQTGTVEAVRNVPASEFYQTLSDGSALINDAGADLVLVDPQFSRFLRTNADLQPYAQAMQQIAAQPDVVLFHRYDLMRYWANEGTIDLERTPKPQRLSTVEALHACLGAHLARLVTSAAHVPS